MEESHLYMYYDSKHNYIICEGIGPEIFLLFGRKKLKDVFHYLLYNEEPEKSLDKSKEDIESLLLEKGYDINVDFQINYLIDLYKFINVDLKQIFKFSANRFELAVQFEDKTFLQLFISSEFRLITTNKYLLQEYTSKILEYYGYWSEDIMPTLVDNDGSYFLAQPNIIIPDKKEESNSVNFLSPSDY